MNSPILPRPLINSIPANLQDHLVANPAHTYFARAGSDAMMRLGICEGDLLVIDTTLSPRHGDLVIAVLNGQKNCKVLDLHGQRLLSGNDNVPPVPIKDTDTLRLEGVVCSSIRYHRFAWG